MDHSCKLAQGQWVCAVIANRWSDLTSCHLLSDLLLSIRTGCYSQVLRRQDSNSSCSRGHQECLHNYKKHATIGLWALHVWSSQFAWRWWTVSGKYHRECPRWVLPTFEIDFWCLIYYCVFMLLHFQTLFDPIEGSTDHFFKDKTWTLTHLGHTKAQVKVNKRTESWKGTYTHSHSPGIRKVARVNSGCVGDFMLPDYTH